MLAVGLAHERISVDDLRSYEDEFTICSIRKARHNRHHDGEGRVDIGDTLLEVVGLPIELVHGLHEGVLAEHARAKRKRFNALEAGFARLIGRARTPWSIPERGPDTEIIIDDVSLSDTVEETNDSSVKRIQALDAEQRVARRAPDVRIEVVDVDDGTDAALRVLVVRWLLLLVELARHRTRPAPGAMRHACNGEGDGGLFLEKREFSNTTLSLL